MCRLLAFLIVAAIAHLGGCAAPPVHRVIATQPTVPDGLSDPIADPGLDAFRVPPVGWIAQPRKVSKQHEHQMWLSPSGYTAYGVIHFSLPLPVGEEIALRGFLREMRKSQGEATLVRKTRDPQTGGINFIAEGGAYVIHAAILTSRFHGWAIYAGTLRNHPIVLKELELALRARENTALGLPEESSGKTVE